MLISVDPQFVYKADTSTAKWTWAAREVITYYNNNGSDVYWCHFRLQQAFDRDGHEKLLQKLISNRLPLVITRSLMKFNMYVNEWGLNLLVLLMVSNKALFYPQFIFIYTLLRWFNSKLEDNGDSCRIGRKYVGIVGFADDLKLLCPSLLGLQRMLNICKAFSTSIGPLIIKTNTTEYYFSMCNVFPGNISCSSLHGLVNFHMYIFIYKTWPPSTLCKVDSAFSINFAH